MNMHVTPSIPDSEVFGGTRPISLAEVMARVEANLTGTKRRDTLSAFRVLSDKAKVDLAATPATAGVVRELLASLSAASLLVTPKRLANLRSLITTAVERFGSRRFWITQEIAPNDSWQELLGLVPAPEYRWSLSRLACYCTVKAISPEEISPDTLLGLHEALEAECVSRAPRKILKQTIAIWNWCQRNVPGWPPVTLSSLSRPSPT